MASGPRTGAAAEAVAKVQTLARKAGHAWNKHDGAFVGSCLDAALVVCNTLEG